MVGCFSRRLSVATAVAVTACAYYDDGLLAPIAETSRPTKGGTGGASGAGGTVSAGQGGGGAPAGSGGAGGGGVGSTGGSAAGQAGMVTAGTSGSAGAATPACVSKRPPGPPATGAGGAGDLSFDLALRDFDFGETSTTNQGGYDLDGACTACVCVGDTGSRCLLPKGSNAVATTDGTDGQDHAARALFLVAAPFLSAFSSTGIREAVEAGSFTVLLRVSQYNGQPNDAQVTVAWYVGSKLPKTPAWDGNDAWPIRDYSLKGGDLNQPTVVDNNAYVRDGLLVAGPKGADGTSREVPMQVSTDFRILLSGVFITGKLVPAGSSFSLEEGILAGKWGTDDVLKQLGGLRFLGQTTGVCPGTTSYQQIAPTVCSAADIALFDGSPTDPCTAISVGISYRATPAKLGVVEVQPPPANDCKTPFDSAKHGCSAL